MSKNFTIQKIVNTSHLKPVLNMIWAVFLDFEAREYSKEGIAEFKRYIEFSNIKNLITNSNMKMWVAYTDNKPVGALATNPDNHISLLFVDKNYHRQGIAKSLFYAMLSSLDKIKYTAMTVNSSLYANEVYKKFGFKNIGETKEVNGIIFIPMKMEL